MNTRIRMLVVGVIVPLVIATAGIIVTLITLPTLPDPVAIHWGPSGGPDGYGPPIVFPIVTAVAVIGYSVVCLAFARRATTNLRVLSAVAPFFATVITGVSAGSLVIQSGLRDARDAPSIVPVVVIAALVGVLLGIIAMMVLPRDESDAAEPPEVPTLDLSATERAVWIQRVGPARAIAIFLVIVGVLVLVGGGIMLWLRVPVESLVLYFAILVVVGVSVVATLAWRVSIDGRGFTARSLLGLPVFRIPLDEVDTAVSVEVDPTGDFGGWGIRWGRQRRLGLILRGGEAIEVRRRDGRSLVVTVAQSERGAALLNSLARRPRV